MKLRKAFQKIVSVSNVLGSLWICFLMLVITYDVGGRTFFHHPIVGTPEIVSNSIVAIAFLQIAYVLMAGRHVRATVLYDKFGDKGRAVLDMLAYLIGLALFVALVFSSWKLFVTAVRVGEFEGEGAMRVPTSPVRFLILYGSVLMFLQFGVMLVDRFLKLIRNSGEQEPVKDC